MDNKCELYVELNRDGLLQYECTNCGWICFETDPVHTYDHCPGCGRKITNQKEMIETELKLVTFRRNILNIFKRG